MCSTRASAHIVTWTRGVALRSLVPESSSRGLSPSWISRRDDLKEDHMAVEEMNISSLLSCPPDSQKLTRSCLADWLAVHLSRATRARRQRWFSCCLSDQPPMWHSTHFGDAGSCSVGTWCSGITSASHAEGPGFKSQCVHLTKRRPTERQTHRNDQRCNQCHAHIHSMSLGMVPIS